jgi:hypothetical protein
MHWTLSARAMKNTTAMTARELVAATTPSNVSRDGILEPARRGKSPIKRAAIVPGSRSTDSPSGSAAINNANL